MTTTRPYRRAAFTLIEMIVVITIIMLMFGTLMSGLATMQKSTDTLSTPAVIQAVHESCFRNARQFGSAALVYGFTLDYGDADDTPFGAGIVSSNAVTGETASAIAIVPWVINVNTTVYHGPTADLFTDIGRSSLWDTSSTPARIYFDDKLRPSRQFYTLLAGTSPPFASPPAMQTHTTSARRYLHVAYEPRSGFVHVYPNNPTDPDVSDPLLIPGALLASPSPANAALVPVCISRPVKPPSQLTLELRDTKNGQVKNKIIITFTGVIDAHAKL